MPVLHHLQHQARRNRKRRDQRNVDAASDHDHRHAEPENAEHGDVLQQRQHVRGGGKARQEKRKRGEHHSEDAKHNGLLCEPQASHPGHLFLVCGIFLCPAGVCKPKCRGVSIVVGGYFRAGELCPQHQWFAIARASASELDPLRGTQARLAAYRCGVTTLGPIMIADLWYKNGIIYCLSVGTYMDANGDGVGDFKGLLRRLDYLHGLGITAIWLMPFQPSPCKDDGYDISDYYGVDPRYGTLGDFVEFTHGCKQRGIRVIIDLVVNHTSDQHAWFKSARSAKDLPHRDWYVWADKRPASAGKGMVFPGRAEIDLDARQAGAAPGTSIASMTSSPISTPRTPSCRRKSSRSWASGSSLASPASAWTPCPS